MRIPKKDQEVADDDESIVNVDQSRLLQERRESLQPNEKDFRSPTVPDEKLKDNSDLIVIESDF